MKNKNTTIKFSGVLLTHSDKIFYPKIKLTKHDLAEYYHRHSNLILPHIINRPIAILRCPEGIAHTCFYQKHTETLPKEINSVAIKEENKIRKHIVIKNEAGLIALVQSGGLEIHTWGCRADNIEKPDRIIFDIDPGVNVDFAKIVECALVLRSGLESLDLQSFVKTSGKKGLHVCVPLRRTVTWEIVANFALGFAQHLEKLAPDLYTTTITKSKRKNKILIDYLRNKRMATCISAYSTRTTAEASLSVPLDWNELPKLKSSNEYNIHNIDSRLKRIKKDPWAKYFTLKQTLPRVKF